jgi:hypothetical protein
MPEAGALLEHALEQVLDDLFLVAAALGVDPIGAILQLIAFVNQQRGVPAIVHDELGALAAGEGQRVEGAVPILFEGFALPGEYGCAGGGDGGGGVVLGGEDVAARPADIGAELLERLDENGRLNGHVERTGDTDALEGLLRTMLRADGHEAGHLMLGDMNGLAAPVSETEVADLEVVRRGPGLAVAILGVGLEGGLDEFLAGGGESDLGHGSET